MYEDRIAELQAQAGVDQLGTKRVNEIISNLKAAEATQKAREEQRIMQERLREQRIKTKVPSWRLREG